MAGTGKTIRWGILSTAKIGVEKVIPGIGRSTTGTVVAIASRDAARAERAAADLGIARAYGSYEALLADPEIDAVYNPLPNHLHVPLTLKAVEAGKHVLCEKPIALDADEARLLTRLPRDKLVAEGFMVRCHPQWLRAREIVRSGALGELRAIQSVFSYFNDDPGNIRNRADIGGGALLDIGCYPMVAGRYFFEAEPERVLSLVERDPAFGTDRLSSALIDFGGGRRLDFTVSTQLVPYQRLQLFGTRKRLEIVIPYNAPQGGETRIVVDDGSRLGDASATFEIIAAADQYAELADCFGRAVLGEAELPFGAEDAVKNMAVLDALFASEASGGWVSLAG
ncbi:Gfo/Idh/MocA family protein [Polymorphum gilvum]|uniref:Oxidoreductase family, NAD-binding Rossmann fold protein n=1 Tax=Polymorphum gilvum (strain LMG 25793 / CGMCC 1.9160 / SL003B-26A1) TaxID=991905 RepID=F2J264_POLGS|nr:Gfo/Idh/MocA family oxidoreductase [Polymorphum gilvum]ADZ68823.1 Oxidoreductase family, NAD-binding Rossmann fold protein [Polymorphum gilvum SL003B-26A1]